MRLSRTPTRRDHAGPVLGADTRSALLAVGLFASIYHPVGTAMLVAHAGPPLGADTRAVLERAGVPAEIVAEVCL